MEGILYRLDQMVNDLSFTSKKIAKYLMEHHDTAIFFTAKKLAEEVGVSQAAVSRFCKAIGVSDLNELKVLLTKDMTNYQEFSLEDFESDEFKKNIGVHLSYHLSSAIKDTCALLSQEKVMKAAELIHKARHIMCAGIGASYLVAEDMSQKLLRVQKSVFVYQDADLRKVALAPYDENDLLIVISHSGKKREMLELASIAHKQNVPIIALTKLKENPLSQLATVTLEVVSYEQEYRIGALSSRISQMYLVDVLFYTFGLFFQEEAMRKARKTYDIIQPNPL